MIRSILTLLVIIVTSLYFFPFSFKILPDVNTKMMLAVVGLMVYMMRLGRGRNASINKDMFFLSIGAAMVSLIGLFSITYNNTPDYAYAGYLVSMWVWLGGAYAVVMLMKCVHGDVTVKLVCNYLIAVCVSQCILALFFDLYTPAKEVIDTYIEQGQDFLNEQRVKRLYGIGASLDVAGSRFSTVLVMIMVVLLHHNIGRRYYWIYVLAFLVIAVAGSMIARTTYVGALIALLYALYMTKIHTLHLSTDGRRFWIWLSAFVVIAIPLAVWAYYNIFEVHKNLRFAFEGFFNLVENGEWLIASNEKLETMYVFPETVKTWLIGDGYFSNPRDVDPLFIGEVVGGYYMGTDVGYLRFIFYFGLVGLLAISAVIVKSALICSHKFRTDRALFLLLLLVNFIVWFKVATDIFLVFALFLMIDKDKEEDVKPCPSK
ncbi:MULTISPECIES: hypothetical protein [Mediterranea]|uniref:hypothetical protein n=1 Tax=Mediterranea TaxID=1926659 RepID=UPI0020123C94|nr:MULTISPECIES: hypothetical protein [Mediterranea]MCL1607695.1 hypothetical protein [Mediterranea sp. ET5]MDM8122053.1 hypothetical protein [Mediterranea massiliensis]MDM8197711.1 hypothetical protein [Mediterranea massiliensis]